MRQSKKKRRKKGRKKAKNPAPRERNDRARMKYVRSSAATCNATATSVHRIFHRSSFVRAVREREKERERGKEKTPARARSRIFTICGLCGRIDLHTTVDAGVSDSRLE